MADQAALPGPPDRLEDRAIQDDGSRWVVQQEDVEIVGAKSAQAGLDRLADVGRLENVLLEAVAHRSDDARARLRALQSPGPGLQQVLEALPRAQRMASLGADDDLLAPAPDDLAEQPLTGAEAVAVGRVEVGNTLVERRLQGGHDLAPRAPAGRDVVAAEADHRGLQAGPAELAVLHGADYSPPKSTGRAHVMA